ncbi:ATP-binding cassette domain-containing protein [Rubrobacter marinus]|uniref:ATP-binding cassette domain-containing protein n=1 Tax=Rubrobacter marinus TaxID=2653852 RepID=A0A6G8Q036_9ACTN|nr:ATP-binding cassette domain-containing protein [Rubrobacter marinus]
MTLKIEAKGLRYAVGGAGILKGVNLAVGRGEVVCVTGPSGSGKSTLLRALNRLVEPDEGEVYLDGVPTKTMDPLALRRRVGMIFQLPALSGETVEEAILYGPRLLGRGADVADLLGAVGLDPELASRSPQSLSVGQQQRVSIARALALEPEVLLMDEPTSALDEAARDRIEGLVRDLNRREGLTFVIVSHDLGQVERLADRVVLVDAGRTAGEWDRDEFDGGGSEKVRRLVSGRS